VVRREAFIRKIHELGYTYKDTAKRVYLYRLRGGTRYIPVPMADLLTDEYVMSQLGQAGCSPEDIQSFLASAKS